MIHTEQPAVAPPFLRSVPSTKSQAARPVQNLFDPLASSQLLTRTLFNFSNESALGFTPLPPNLNVPPELYEGQATKKAEAERIDAELRLLQQNQHPEQLKLRGQNQAQVERQLAPLKARLEAAKAQRDTERHGAQKAYDDAVAREQSGFQPDQQAHAKASAAFESRKKALIGKAGAKAGLLSELLSMHEGMQRPGLDAKMKKGYQDRVEVLLQGLTPPLKADEINGLLTEQSAVRQAGEFPRFPVERANWLKQRADERDAAFAAADGKLAQAQGELDTTADRLQKDAAARESKADAALAARLRGSSDKARSVQPGSVQEAVRKSRAFITTLNDGRANANGIEFADRQGKVELTIKTHGDGTIEVTSDRPDRHCVSTLKPAGNGKYSETVVETQYQTVYSERTSQRGKEKQRGETRINEKGEETYARTESPWGDGKEVSLRETTATGTTSSTVHTDAQGKARKSYKRVVEQKDGQTVTTTENLNEDGSTWSDVRRKQRDGSVRVQGQSYYPRLKSTTVREGVERADGSHSLRSETRSNDGIVTNVHESEKSAQGGLVETTTSTDPQSKVEYRWVKVNGKEVRQSSRRPVSPQLDVAGWKFMGRNPQELLANLGDAGKITAEEISETSGGKTVKVTRYVSGDGKAELLQTHAESGGDMWQLRKQNQDGSWNSQTFFQGTKDTIVSKTTQQGSFQVTEDTSTTPEIAKSMPHMPSQGTATTHTSDAASPAEVRQLLRSHRLHTAVGSDAFESFMSANGNEPLKVFLSKSSSLTGEQRDYTGSMILETKDGRRLSAAVDPKSGTTTVQVENKSGQPRQMSFIKGGERLEFDAEKGVCEVDGDKRTLLGNAASASKILSKGAEGTVNSATKVPDAMKGWAARFIDPEVEDLAAAINKSKWAPRVGSTLGVGFTLVNGLSLGVDVANGDYEAAARKAGTLGVDVASLTKTYGGKLPTGGQPGAWVGKGARFLGAAGLVAGAAFAGKDFYDGDYARGAIGTVGVAGTLLPMIFAGTSWAGPVGIGLTVVAAAGTFAWDYNQGVSVAGMEI